MKNKTYIRPELQITFVAPLKQLMIPASFLTTDTDADPNIEMQTKDWCKWKNENFNEF